MNEMTAQMEQEWATQFDVTLDQIRTAVKEVGTGKADVEMYLKGVHSTTDAEVTQQADDAAAT